MFFVIISNGVVAYSNVVNLMICSTWTLGILQLLCVQREQFQIPVRIFFIQF